MKLSAQLFNLVKDTDEEGLLVAFRHIIEVCILKLWGEVLHVVLEEFAALDPRVVHPFALFQDKLSLDPEGTAVTQIQ